ncbi:RNA polymerase sigma-70 factor [Prevotella sp. 10(H)]|uniref:RNA polymerase sigma-70 factor n=1 Tax=Prevotella sp. 10(H) TaxID=1158294 RepID=UPI0004A757D4|nr:RNA polymerase sigma-70 factor [Prevotella sp. 10(H)]
MYNNESDEDLLTLVKGGNKKAFDAFFLRYYASLCAYAKQYVKAEDTHEAVQDVMMWVWENSENIKISQSVRSYIFGAVRYKCLNIINSNSTKKRAMNILHEEMMDIYESPDFYILQDLTEKIEDAINNLPDLYREAFIKNRFENKTYQQIATELGVSPKTIDYRIQQALKILRVSLREYLPLLSFWLFTDL